MLKGKGAINRVLSILQSVFFVERIILELRSFVSLKRVSFIRIDQSEDNSSCDIELT